MNLDIYIAIFTSGKFLVVLFFLIVIFPLIFSIASLEKSSFKLPKPAPKPQKPKAAKEEKPSDDEEDDADDEE